MNLFERNSFLLGLIVNFLPLKGAGGTSIIEASSVHNFIDLSLNLLFLLGFLLNLLLELVYLLSNNWSLRVGNHGLRKRCLLDW